MIKTIKVKKQLRLDELIKYVWSSEISDSKFFCDSQDAFLRVSTEGEIYSNYAYEESDTFTIEVKEDITDDMKFDIVLVVYVDGSFTTRHGVSIKEIRQNTDVKQIHTTISNNLELIWEREKQ